MSERPAYMDKITTLRRNRTGDFYHRAGCPRLRPTSLPWVWAEDKSRAEVAESHANGLRPCAVCDPLGAIEVTA